jgi:threonine aldolase
MADAEVGDDGFGDDPTVARLEAVFAERVGKEAAVFVPSGTMANQIALRVLGTPGSVVLCGRRQHVVVREVAAAGANSAVQLVTLDDADGTLDPAEVQRWADDARVGWAAPSAVFVEDTHGEVGGRVWPLSRLEEVAAVGLPVHLDGARLWNAAVASGTTVAERAAVATTVTCCVSKGLGAPVGSVLAGPSEVIRRARVERKRLGGGMRQVGVLAAAGLVALDRVDRLAEDHARARRLAEAAAARWPGSVDVALVQTNILRIAVDDPGALLAHLAADGVLAVPGSATTVRLVTHADVDDDDVERTIRSLESAP